MVGYGARGMLCMLYNALICSDLEPCAVLPTPRAMLKNENGAGKRKAPAGRGLVLGLLRIFAPCERLQTNKAKLRKR